MIPSKLMFNQKVKVTRDSMTQNKIGGYDKSATVTILEDLLARIWPVTEKEEYKIQGQEMHTTHNMAVRKSSLGTESIKPEDDVTDENGNVYRVLTERIPSESVKRDFQIRFELAKNV